MCVTTACLPISVCLSICLSVYLSVSISTNTFMSFSGWNACADNNGGCSHLCLSKPGKRVVCACSNHFNLRQGDNKTCEGIHGRIYNKSSQCSSDSTAQKVLCPGAYLNCKWFGLSEFPADLSAFTHKSVSQSCPVAERDSFCRTTRQTLHRNSCRV